VTTASLTDFSDPTPDTPCLTFGKHRGEPLTAIDTSYLEWVRTADRITPDLLAAITAELATRQPKVAVQDRWRAPQGVPADVTEMAKLLVAAGAMELEGIPDYRVGAATALLEWCISAIELESDPGTLVF
jgi:hypothetical protein